MSGTWKTAVVAAKRIEAEHIVGFDLVDPRGRPLTEFSAGSHIDVEVTPELIRQYSLCNDPNERHRYQIAVLRECFSRGGSIALTDNLSVGDEVHISDPRNHFPLDPSARRVLLVAGGIGITPILAMAEHLFRAQTPFELHYCTRGLFGTAFYERITGSPFSRKVSFHFDNEPNTKLDLPSVLREVAPEDHLYVCGPAGFIDLVMQTAGASAWKPNQLHREFFGVAAADRVNPNRSFTMQIRSTGATFRVGPTETAVDVLRANGIDVPTSCEQGVCGTCIVRVIEGIPEHRDLFMTDQEHERNGQFTPCCSRARSDMLVLDL